MITLTLPIAPVAWQRVKRGAYGQAYVPVKTRKFKADVAKLARRHFQDGPSTLPVVLRVTFFLVPPKRPKFKVPAVRPDLDNYLKAIKDGLNEVAWRDDGQIYDCHARKLYDWTTKTERIEIEMEEVK